MKPIAISTFVTFAALSLCAAEPRTASDTAPPPPLHVQKSLSSPQSGGLGGDSPLVRAAKATKRTGKNAGQVITNESLVRVGGHFTTTTPQAQQPLPGPPIAEPGADQKALEARRSRAKTSAAAAEKAKKVEDQKKTAAARAAAREEGDGPEAIFDDPPALEGTIQPMKPVNPQTMGQTQKPPQ